MNGHNITTSQLIQTKPLALCSPQIQLSTTAIWPNINNKALPYTFLFTYTFLFMNIARLLTKSKPKIKFLSDLCESHTLFLCLCEAFLSSDISDNELLIPDFTITRCDRKSRMGGGVCIYICNSVIFDTCLRYSNSVCDLLIVRLHNPSLIIMSVYRPPSC